MEFSAVIFFGCLQCPEIHLFSRKSEAIQSQIRGIGWVFHFSNEYLGLREGMPCELEHCHGGESNLWAFFYTQFYIPQNKLG
jgi:hypothetical protein